VTTGSVSPGIYVIYPSIRRIPLFLAPLLFEKCKAAPEGTALYQLIQIYA
jgi:hypothetical protein